MTISVALTEYEMQMLAQVGRERDASARALGRDPGLGPTAQPGNYSGHVRGAQCEFAAHIGLNLFWRPSIGIINAIDVGDLAQVRSTDLRHGRLIVKPNAVDEDPYVLVLQDGRVHTLLGWLDAGAAKRSVPLNANFGDPAHYIDQRLLRDIHTLKRRLHHGLALGGDSLRITIAPKDATDAARIAAQIGGLLERGLP